jgi:hypothetical protein
MAMLSAAIARHTLIVRLDDAGQQLIQVPMISIAGQAILINAIGADHFRFARFPVARYD